MTPTQQIAALTGAARLLLTVDLTPEVESAMSDAVSETDGGVWIDADRWACVSSEALTNAWFSALRAIADTK